MATDLGGLSHVAGMSGHAGPTSSWAYIHQLEGPMAYLCQQARPNAWTPVAEHPLRRAVFPPIGEGLLDKPRATPPARQDEPGLLSSGELTLEQRADIAARLVDGQSVAETAGRCSLPVCVVEQCAVEIALAMSDARFTDSRTSASVKSALLALRAYRTWARASLQAKYLPVAALLSRRVAAGQWDQLRQVCACWLLLLDGRDISLDRPRQAGFLIDFLVNDVGVGRTSLAVTTSIEKRDWPDSLARRRLDRRRCAPRAVQAMFRLAMSPRGVPAAGGNAATVSVVGIHWCMFLASSALIAKG